MTTRTKLARWTLALLLAAPGGCATKDKQPTVALDEIRPTPIGTISDAIWQQQEENAEASDFVVHEHEWVGNSTRLNAAGKEHVKQIAARAPQTPFPVLVERSSMSSVPDSRHGFPVNGHEDLDAQRRELIVHALSEMGVSDADGRVLVSPALTPGFQDFEGERAYNRGFSDMQGFGNGLGGYGGGFGGIGGGFF